MSQNYSKCYYHIVFSTKDRNPSISKKWRDQLWKYFAGVAANTSMNSICINGTHNHVHILVIIPTSMTVAKAVQLLKSNSSRWINESHPVPGLFRWQGGYSAFTVGQSQVDDTIKYISNQEEHHRSVSFDEEYHAFLDKHGIDFGSWE